MHSTHVLLLFITSFPSIATLLPLHVSGSSEMYSMMLVLHAVQCVVCQFAFAALPSAATLYSVLTQPFAVLTH